MKITKIDKARVIIQALYMTRDLPDRDDRRVKREARLPMEFLTDKYNLAHKILTDAVKTGYFDNKE